jgi:hypothetical protein
MHGQHHWAHEQHKEHDESLRADQEFQQRNLPARGFRPGVLLLGMGAVMTYGWYRLFIGIREAKYVSLPLHSPPSRSNHKLVTTKICFS